VIGHLPNGNYRGPAVTIGHTSFIFGGRNETNVTNAIIKVDLDTGAASFAPFSLPEPRMSSSVVLDKNTSNVYIFAGSDGPFEKDTIYRFNSSQGKVETLGVKIPHPRVGSAAAWSGRFAYLFGGHSNGTMLKEIIKFDPKTLNVTVLKAELPSGRAGMSIVTTPSGIFLFGGNTDAACSANGALDEVLKFDPKTGNLTKMLFKTPYPFFHASGAWTGFDYYIFGGSAVKSGQNVSQVTDTIIQFNYTTSAFKMLDAKLPSPRERAAGAYLNGKAYVFGGQSGVKALDEVVAISFNGNEKTSQDTMMPVVVAMTSVLIVIALVVAWYLVKRGRDDGNKSA
jgi:N-acetylneuraminic acid mutarotase